LGERVGILSRLFRRSRSEPVSQADLARYMMGEPSWSAIDVDRHSSIAITTVWACVRLITETLASLPLILYRRLPNGGKERAVEHPLYDLLRTAPNTEQTSFLWREQGQGHLLLRGNLYSQIVRGGDGYPQQLWPLDPERMDVERKDGIRRYAYQTKDKKIELPAEDVLHIPGLGWDGIKGYDVITVKAQELGSNVAAARFGAEFFGNAAAPSGYIKMPGVFKDLAAQKRMQQSWEDAHGWGKKHRTAILEQGSEWQAMSIAPEQAQFLETRKFNRTDVAAMFRTPPHMVGDLERATFSNIEEQAIEFVVYTMRPWFVRWEQSLNMRLLPLEDQGIYFWEFLVDGLLRGNAVARWTAYRTAREIGALSADEVRELENMNPIPDGNGQGYFVPANWIPIEKAGELLGQQPAGSTT